MQYEFSEMIRVIIVVAGGALFVGSVMLMFLLYEMATEAKEWFSRENHRARQQPPSAS